MFWVSSLADAAATGTVLLPEMKKRGFKPAFSSAVIASAATVGPIVKPPSISFVLLGAIVNVSVSQLFLGGVVPGVLMFLGMFAVTWWICKSRKYPVEKSDYIRESYFF